MRLWTICLCCTLALPAGAQVRTAAERQFIAFRYDAERVVPDPVLFPLSHLGEILGMTDADDAGWAEILMSSSGCEARRVTAYEFTATAPEPVGAHFEWGC